MRKNYFLIMLYLFFLVLPGCSTKSGIAAETEYTSIQNPTGVKADSEQTGFPAIPEELSVREQMRKKITDGINYLWFFGNWNEIQLNTSYLNTAKDFGMVLLHLTNNDINPEHIISLRKGHDGISGTEDDVLVIGYLSVGEDIQTDKDHQQPLETGDEKGPVYWDYENKEKVYQNNGYPSYYLDDRDKDGLPDRNWQYLGCYADPGNPDYQTVLKNGEKEQDGFVGLDEMFSLYQCDGVFLDTMDIVNPLGWGFPFYFEWVADGGQKFIEQLRNWYPDKLILLNRTLVYFDPNQKQEDGTPYLGTWGKQIENDIDLLLFEGFYWPGDEVRNRYYWAPKINAEADRTGGFTVLALDYVGDASITVDGYLTDWIVNGGIQEGVEKLDDALIWSKGVYTPNETEDCATAGVDIIDLWMANDPDNISMFMRMDFAGPVDLDAYNYYVFIDSDQNKKTGYWNTSLSAIGSDFMITDYNTDTFMLYAYTNRIGNELWEWEPIALVPYAVSTRSNNGIDAIELEINRTMLGETNTFDEAVDLLVFTEDHSTYPYITDMAPDNQQKDYYQYLSRTKALGFLETITRQGWLTYNKPLVGGSKTPLLNLDAASVMKEKDTEPPVWDSTAASPGVAPPAAPVPRIGIQEAVPDDGSITVRWDTVRDKSRPVTYTIYFSTKSPIDPETAYKIEKVDTTTAGTNYYRGTGRRTDFPNGTESPHGFYSQKVGEGVYPYEYTITGLQNGTTYYCMVRASDNAENPNTETNTVELTAAPQKSTKHTINVDGNAEDWEKITGLDYSPGETADPDTLPEEIDITEIKITEDSQKLYILITVEGEANFKKMADQISILIDTDTDKDTGYTGPYVPTFPWASGADFLIQNGSFYKYAPVNGYRVWNWEMVSENGDGVSEMVYNQRNIEFSITKSALGNPQNIHLVFETDKLLNDGSHLIDKAPNDLFSHYYSYRVNE